MVDVLVGVIFSWQEINLSSLGKTCSSHSVTWSSTVFPASINMTTSEAGVMTAGNVYTLTCHIQHVAPAQNLNLRWFKGSELQKEDRGPQDSSGGPRDLTFDLQITPDTSDDGAEYRCEAELKLDSVVVQLPKLTSQQLKISVARK